MEVEMRGGSKSKQILPTYFLKVDCKILFANDHPASKFKRQLPETISQCSHRTRLLTDVNSRPLADATFNSLSPIRRPCPLSRPSQLRRKPSNKCLLQTSKCMTRSYSTLSRLITANLGQSTSWCHIEMGDVAYLPAHVTPCSPRSMRPVNSSELTFYRLRGLLAKSTSLWTKRSCLSLKWAMF